MVEDSERLGCPGVDGCGWDSGHSDITDMWYILRLRAEFVRHEHKDRSGVARRTSCDGAGAGGLARPPTPRRAAAGRRASRP